MANRTYKTAPVIAGAIYANPNFHGRHVEALCTGRRETLSSPGKWTGFFLVPGFGEYDMTENDETMVPWTLIARPAACDPISSELVAGDADMDEKDLEIRRLRQELSRQGERALKAEAALDRTSAAA